MATFHFPEGAGAQLQGSKLRLTCICDLFLFFTTTKTRVAANLRLGFALSDTKYTVKELAVRFLLK